MKLNQKIIDEIVHRLKNIAQPDKVILFGSSARGKMTRDSDIDLLILEADPKDPYEESVRIREALGDLGYPLDIIIMKTQWFEQSKEIIGGLAYPANKYGKVIYESPRKNKTQTGKAVVRKSRS